MFASPAERDGERSLSRDAAPDDSGGGGSGGLLIQLSGGGRPTQLCRDHASRACDARTHHPAPSRCAALRPPPTNNQPRALSLHVGDYVRIALLRHFSAAALRAAAADDDAAPVSTIRTPPSLDARHHHIWSSTIQTEITNRCANRHAHTHTRTQQDQRKTHCTQIHNFICYQFYSLQ
jgi:hypothetical protein